MQVKSDAYKAAQQKFYKLFPKEQEKDEIKQQQKSRKEAALRQKMISGRRLTSDERAYLESNCPELANTLRRIEAEQKAYMQSLKACKTKEQVQRKKAAKMAALMGAMKAAKEGNGSVDEVLMRTTAMQQVEQDFARSSRYERLPSERSLRERRRGGLLAKA